MTWSIYGFAYQYIRQHADNVLERLIIGTSGLADHPGYGVPQTRYESREVRKILLDDYDVYYEIQSDIIYIVDHLAHPRRSLNI
ncbi:Uncharacterised protein [Serratia fonticola]|nr:Uncharacterised protein [Serratia fonticola]